MELIFYLMGAGLLAGVAAIVGTVVMTRLGRASDERDGDAALIASTCTDCL